MVWIEPPRRSLGAFELGLTCVVNGDAVAPPAGIAAPVAASIASELLAAKRSRRDMVLLVPVPFADSLIFWGMFGIPDIDMAGSVLRGSNFRARFALVLRKTSGNGLDIQREGWRIA